jgi:glycosyltransferase involved in cell wall biosynthesis
MAGRLLKRGHDVRILVRTLRRSFREWGRYIRDAILYPDAPDFLAAFGGTVQPFVDIERCQFSPSEIIVSVGMAESAKLRALEGLPNPKVQYLHGITPWYPELMRTALTSPFPKIVVSSFLKELVESGGRGEVLGVVHNGVDLNEYYSSLPDSERDGVGTVYSSHQAKDPATLLAVIKRLSARRPNIPMRVFGSCRRPKSISRKSFWRYPSLRQAREIYSRSLVWILASSSEGFSVPVLEAMACGCAVVATDCGGPRDIIQDGQNGFLVNVGDVNGIVDRVQLLLDNGDLRARFRQNAQETLDRFTWEKCVSKLEDTLEGLVCGRPPHALGC